MPEPKYLFDLLPESLRSSALLIGWNATENDLEGVTNPWHLTLALLLFHTGIYSIKRYDRYSNTYFLHYPNRFFKEHFEETVFFELTGGLEMKTPSPFLNLCKKMVDNLLIGDSDHVRQSFNIIDTLCSRIGYSKFPSRPRHDIKNTVKINLSQQEYYFKLEGAFQFWLSMCLEVSQVGDVHIEKEVSGGREDIEFLIPMNSKIIIYELKIGAANVVDALNQCLRLYATAHLAQKKNVICTAIIFSKESRRPMDWIYAEYNEDGNFVKSFSLKPHKIEITNLYNMSNS